MGFDVLFYGLLVLVIVFECNFLGSRTSKTTLRVVASAFYIVGAFLGLFGYESVGIVVMLVGAGVLQADRENRAVQKRRCGRVIKQDKPNGFLG